MMFNVSLRAFLPDAQLNRIYFEFQLVFNSKEALFNDEEVVDKSIKLKRIDVQSKVDNKCNAFCSFEAMHSLIGQLKLSLNVDHSKISISNVHLGDFNLSEDFCDNYAFDLDAEKQFELCFSDEKTLQETSPVVNIDAHSISVHFYFSLVASIKNYPEPSERDLSLCAIFDRPSADLLNDWVFCGHSHGESSSHSHAEEPPSIPIPEELYKPIVLDKVEQIIYLLTDASPTVLLESAEQKDNSIYLEFIKNDGIYCLDYNCINGDNDDVKEEKTEKCVTSENGGRSVSFNAQCLVRYQIFAQKCNEQEATTTTTLESAKDKISPPKSQPINSTDSVDDKKKKEELKKYRLSFEVDWFRIEAKLYSSLVQQLTDSTRYLGRLKDNFAGASYKFQNNFDSCLPLELTPKKQLALLSNYTFVNKEVTKVANGVKL